MFIDQDDQIILMDLELNRLGLDDLKQLADIGIKTVYYHGAIPWGEMQPTAESPINYDRLDQYMVNIEQAGLRALIPFVYSLPQWKPDNWFLTREGLGIASYTNPTAGEEIDNLAKEIIARYDPKITQLIYAMPADGEFPVHFFPYSGSLPFANSVLSDFVVARQRIFAAQHGEIWTAFHTYTNPGWWDDLYSALQSNFPDCAHYAIQFTYYIHASNDIYNRINNTSEKFGIGYFGGSEYCSGLRGHTPICISQKQRGFITAPIHPFQSQHIQFEPWMIDELKWALSELKGERNA